MELVLHQDSVLFSKTAQKVWQAPCLLNAVKGVLCLSSLNSGSCHNLCWENSITSHKWGRNNSRPLAFPNLPTTCAHTQTKYRKRPRGNSHKVQVSVGEKLWHGPVVSHCWAMIDIRSVHSTSLLPQKKQRRHLYHSRWRLFSLYHPLQRMWPSGSI